MNEAVEGRSSSSTAMNTIEMDLMASFDETYDFANVNYTVDTSKLRCDEKNNGFDNNVGDSWIYPTNYPVREYQYEITKVALYQNTLVVLPTGLGKTFLAAVVMYNFYRWYPRGKVVFMAPTLTLVDQQIEACYQIMGISKEDTATLTGRIHTNKLFNKRVEIWKSKRVFFITPHVLENDINNEDFPVNDIKLIVVDEAHRAKGNYSYTKVISSIYHKNQLFRVLALSATPGRELKDVAEVVQNLLISHIEVRSESSPDLKPYTHKIKIQTDLFELDNTLKFVKAELMEIIDPYVQNLKNAKAITDNSNTGNLDKGWLRMQQINYLKDMKNKESHLQQKSIESDFSFCLSMYHAVERLERHGLRVFLSFFDINKEDKHDNKKYFLTRHTALMLCVNRIRNSIVPNPFEPGGISIPNAIIPEIPEGFDFGHPKYEKLRNHLLDHFNNYTDSKALVFCELRDSVYLIYQLLLQNEPLIKPKTFIGQATSKGPKVTQKQQIATMKEFRKGTINVLIATCVAEEGIDVGEVDLIICFDTSSANPTRLVQRMGRTGRRRDGKVVMLVTKGKENEALQKALRNKEAINSETVKCKEITAVLRKSPRLVPTEFDPQCIETYIKIKGVKSLAAKGSNEKANKVKQMAPVKAIGNQKKPNHLQSSAYPSQDVRYFFKPKKIVKIASVESKSIHEQLSIALDLEETDSFDMTNIRPALQALERVKQNFFKKFKRSAKFRVPPMSEIAFQNGAPIDLKNYALNTANVLNSHKNYIPNVLTDFKDVFEDLDSNVPLNFAENLEKTVHEDLFKIYEDKPMSDVQNFTQYPEFGMETQMPYIESVSIYHSQTLSPIQQKLPLQSSTPLKAANHSKGFSTPFKSVKKTKKISSKKKSETRSCGSSIKRAFQRSLEIQQQEKKKTPVLRTVNAKEALAFFMLNKVFDIFDDARVPENITPKRPSKSSDKLDKFCIDTSDLFKDNLTTDEPAIQEEQVSLVQNDALRSDITTGTQHTISEILDIVNDGDEKKEDVIAGPLNVTQEQFSLRKLQLNDFTNILDDEFVATQSASQPVADDSFSEIIQPSQAPPVRTSYLLKAQRLKKSTISNLSATLKENESPGASLKPSSTSPLTAKPVTRQISADIFEETIKSVTCESLKGNASPRIATPNPIMTIPKVLKESIYESPTKPSPASCAKDDKSPSVLSGRTKISRLKLHRLHDINSLPVPTKTIPVFATRSEVVTSHTSRAMVNLENSFNVNKNTTAPSNRMEATNKIDLNVFRYQPSTQENRDEDFDESSIVRVQPRKNKRIIYDDSSSSDDDDIQTKSIKFAKPSVARQIKPKKKAKSDFVLDECAVSGNDVSEDELEPATQLEHIDDSIVCMSDEEDDPEDMHAKYLQSIRSPNCRSGAFRIPVRRDYTNISNVFSQAVLPETTVLDESFVVLSSDEEALEVDKSMCPLERAELILKERNRTKRKLAKQGDDSRKKRRILPMLDN